MIPFFVIATAREDVTLSCPAPSNVRKMRVVGDFNHWNAPGRSMQISGDGLHWNLNLALDPGVYRYVFLENSHAVPTGKAFEGRVQMLILTPPDFKHMPAVKGDGLITKSGVAHRTDSPYVKRLNDFTYQLRLRTRKDDVSGEAVAVWSDSGEQKTYPMKFEGSDPLFDYYSVKVVVNGMRNFYYRFLLDDGQGIRCFDEDGLKEGVLGTEPFKIGPVDFVVPPVPVGQVKS